MEQNIIEKLKKSGLTGRSGSCFPVWKKWEAVKNAVSGPIKSASGGASQFNGAGNPPSLLRSFGEAKKYVVCNGSEEEPGVFKDKYILQNYPEEVIDGIKILFTPGYGY